MTPPTVLVVLFSIVCTPSAAEVNAVPPVPAAAEQILGHIVRDNDLFVRQHPQSYFDRFRDAQSPTITLVACADARFHVSDLDSSPDGEVYTVRNIGNQVDSTPGSVEYGIRHLHTPLLLIVGHVGCGAVKAALEDYGSEAMAIRRELDGLHLALRKGSTTDSIDKRWLAGVIANVHQQVEEATREYATEVNSGRLTVVGGVYDFRNDLGRGKGRLVVLDINGEKDPAQLQKLPVLRAAAPK